MRWLQGMALAATTALLWPAAAGAVEVNVNFSNAETNFGFVNTSLHTLGSLYFQQRGSNDVTYLMDIDSPDAKRSKTLSIDSVESAAPRGLTFSFGLTGLEVLKEAAITAEAKRTARIYVKNVTTEQYAEPLSLVNSPNLATERSLYATFCAPAACRFVFVYHVTKVDEGGFGFGRAVTVGGKLIFPTVARIQGFDAKIGYDSSSALSWQGKSSPMFYKVLNLVLLPKGDGFVFLPDIPRRTTPAKQSTRR